MRRLVNRFIAPIAAVATLAVYIPFSLAIQDDNFQAELLRAAQATVMTCAAVFFVLALKRAFDANVPDSARRFYIGLILWASAADAGAVWRLLWRMAGGGAELAWMLTNDAVTFLLWMEIVGVFFMLSGPAVPGRPVPGLETGEPEDISWRRVVVAAVLCVAVAYLIVVERTAGTYIADFLVYLSRPT